MWGILPTRALHGKSSIVVVLWEGYPGGAGARKERKNTNTTGKFFDHLVFLSLSHQMPGAEA